MTFDIGTIVGGTAPILVLILLTWWYSAREKRRRNEKRRASQVASKQPIAMRDTRQDIVSIIWTFFDEMETHFELTTEKDSVECFTVGFDGTDGEIMMRVCVMADREMYQIIGQQNTFITESNRDAAIRAINKYNMESNAVAGCISKDGAVTFWIGRYTDGGSFSVDSFAREFSMVLAAAEDTTGQILKDSSESGLV